MKCVHPLLKGREQNLIRQKLQNAMASANIDFLILVRADNIFYATGLRSNFAFQYNGSVCDTIALVPRSGNILLIVNSLERDCAENSAADGIDVESYPSGAFIDDGSAQSRADKVLDRFAALKAAFRHTGKNARVATESAVIPHEAWDLLCSTYGKVQDAEPVVMQARKIKTPWEIDTLRHAVQLTEAVWNRIARETQPGMNALELSRKFKAYSLEQDHLCALSDDQFIPAVGPFIGVGPMPRDYVIQDGDIIKFDAGFRYCNYSSDIARTLAVGTVPKVAVDIYNILYHANRIGVEAIHPGVRFSEIYWTVRSEVERSSLIPRYPRGNVGHSIGVCTQIVEGPSFTPNCHERIEEGMVFTLETPWSGTRGAVVNAGYNIEDCYVVTKDGVEPFTHAPSTIYWGH